MAKESGSGNRIIIIALGVCLGLLAFWVLKAIFFRLIIPLAVIAVVLYFIWPKSKKNKR
jgi:uncharacterized membrane protein YfcA